MGGGNKKIKASGISKGTSVELFDKVDVTFTGVSPQAGIVITNNWEDEYLSGLTFTPDKKDNISLGDSVKITCNTSYEDIARHGFLVHNIETSYNADKLPEYVDDVSLIDKKVVEQVSKEVLETINKETADNTFHMLYKATRILPICITLMRKHAVMQRLLEYIIYRKKEMLERLIITYI